MTEPALDYAVRDKSLLLPLYKRLFIEPVVPRLPKRLAPNAITHAGHLVNLAGVLVLALWGSRAGGLPFFFAAAMIHLYNWADNADGAHARHTGQCSVRGEFLDHGLDLFNAMYVAAVGALAIGASPLATLAMVLVVVAAAAVIYWEQAETGTFQLGWLNQIEAVFAASVLLVIAGVFGTDVFLTRIGPVTLRSILTTVLIGNAVLGIAHCGVRVARKAGTSVLLPFAQSVAFCVAIFASAWTSALSPVVAGTIGVAGFVFLGVRNLTLRLQKRPPRFELGVAVVTVLLATSCAIEAAHLLRAASPPWVAIAGGALGLTFFAAYAVKNTCVSQQAIAALESSR